MEKGKEEYRRFLQTIKQWKDNNLEEFTDYCRTMCQMDGEGIVQTAKTLMLDCPKFFKAWCVCANDESFEDYSALEELVSQSDFAEKLIAKFHYRGNDHSIPLFFSWLNYANSFETILQVISDKITPNCSYFYKKVASFGINRAINVSLKHEYRTEEQWHEYLSIEEDAGTDNMAIRILRKRFNGSNKEVAVPKEEKSEYSTHVTNNYYSQQNISINQNVFNRTVYVYDEPIGDVSEEGQAHEDHNEQKELRTIEYNIPAETQKLEYYIRGIDNVPELMKKIEKRIRLENSAKVYAQIKIILEEQDYLDTRCIDELKMFYNALLLQFKDSDIIFKGIRAFYKAYGLLNQTRKTGKGAATKAKDMSDERTLIDNLAQCLLGESVR